jgi:hypothetical protein
MLLYVAFGWSVWKSAGTRALRHAGGAIVVAAVIGIFWPPMHLREVLAAGGGTLSDRLHIVWTGINAVLTMLAILFASTAFGRGFRVYSMATLGIVLGAGIVTSFDAPLLQANLPTPWMGVWERINIGAWLLWIAVLSVMLSRRVPRRSIRAAEHRTLAPASTA